MKQDLPEHTILHDCRKAMRLTVMLHVLCSCLTGVFSVYSAGILGNFADAVLHMDMAYGIHNAAKLILCIFVVVVILPTAEMFSNQIMLKDSFKHDRIVLKRFLNKRFLSVRMLDAGEFQHRIEDDPCDLRIDWVLIVTNICMAVMTSAFLGYRLREIPAGFTGCAIGLMLIKLSVPVALRNIRAGYDSKTRDYQTALRSGETDITEKPHIVKQLGLTEPMIKRLDDLYRTYFHNVFRKSVVCTAIADTASSYLDTFCILAILLTGAVMTARGYISAAQAAAMTGYFGVLGNIAGSISYVIKQCPLFRNLLERNKVLYADAESGGLTMEESFTGCITQNLSCAYNGNPVLTNLDLTVNAAEKTAIRGRNGCGKSTLLHLICGLYDEYEGRFLLNGLEAKQIDPHDKRRQFACAVQEPYLFQGTVTDNILLGNPDASEEKALQVMKDLQIGHLAERTVSMKQNDLSGGEKQKISIARALLKNAPVLALDEPEANLDAESIDRLADFIRAYDKTVIFITHDERLLAAADQVIELTSGRAAIEDRIFPTCEPTCRTMSFYT